MITSSGFNLGPVVTVAVGLFIVMCLIWAIPIGLNLMQTRPARTFNNIDRADRTEAAIFCYSITKAEVERIKKLLTLDEKKAALEAEYLRLNPNEAPAQAAVIIKAYLDIYGAEVGMADSVLRSRAVLPTGTHDAAGKFVPFDFSDAGLAPEAAAISEVPVASEVEPSDEPSLAAVPVVDSGAASDANSEDSKSSSD